MSTRRKPTSNLASTNGQPTPLTASMPASSIRNPLTPSNTRSPFLPTRLEAQLLAIYPVTLLLGSIFSTLSPASRGAPYSAVSQSHDPATAPSYFAQKKNVFNVYFVKKGWFWTTLAFAIFLVFNSGLGPGLTKKRIRSVLRYAAITTWWVIVTQWFFGPPLIDRGFRFTGGQCEVLRDPVKVEGMSEAREYFTAQACKAVGGQWKGGHDISGHVFLLILGSSLLWFETLPAMTRTEGLRDGRRVLLADGKVASVNVEREDEGETGEGEMTGGTKFALGVTSLMWWMLLMTAAYFHTWFEKFTGLLVAFIGLWVVYFAPRGIPGLRAVLGMPGV
ncbi:inositol phospholipid synthesis and fat-storage-inducing TM-domain-containing protein [Lophiotrema nucula]|uniref:Acyl-coenzyme A diphosphatase SCS3 n=1 Tax=Lophiotrema nucula TaxID=690887 RepID=A0A6A5YJU2_9PLEO|nr:inositol phospholipid synthesis and fat-storage-inducing TM-domain-containing protein [Lophiotrema nucula]